MADENKCVTCGLGGDLKQAVNVIYDEIYYIHRGDCKEALIDALESERKRCTELDAELKELSECSQKVALEFDRHTDELQNKLNALEACATKMRELLHRALKQLEIVDSIIANSPEIVWEPLKCEIEKILSPNNGGH